MPPPGAAPVDARLYPVDPVELGASLATCPREALQITTFKMDRLRDGEWWGTLLAYRKDLKRTVVWPGFRVHDAGVTPPPYLAGLAEPWHSLIMSAVDVMTRYALSQPQGRDASSHTVTVNGADAPRERLQVGGDRITPGDTHPVVYVHHAKRYRFATAFATDRKVLDVGCGVGYGTQMLARVARSVLGVDASTEATAYAGRVYGGPRIAFAAGDARCLPLPSASVDLVVWFEMIEHIEEQQVAMAEVARVLRPSGQVIVSTPNKLIYAEQPDPEHYHCGLLTLEEFARLVRSAFRYVDLWSQPRLRGEADITREFDVIPGVDDDQEIFIAVGTGPRTAIA